MNGEEITVVRGNRGKKGWLGKEGILKKEEKIRNVKERTKDMNEEREGR